jgi:hypothetical protein
LHSEIIKTLKTNIELSHNGDEWTMNFNTAGMNNAITFKIGQEFSHTTPSGHVVKGIFRKVGDRLVETLTFENGFQPDIDVDFNDKGLKMVGKFECCAIVSVLNVGCVFIADLHLAQWKICLQLQASLILYSPNDLIFVTD